MKAAPEDYVKLAFDMAGLRRLSSLPSMGIALAHHLRQGQWVAIEQRDRVALKVSADLAS